MVPAGYQINIYLLIQLVELINLFFLKLLPFLKRLSFLPLFFLRVMLWQVGLSSWPVWFSLVSREVCLRLLSGSLEAEEPGGVCGMSILGRCGQQSRL